MQPEKFGSMIPVCTGNLTVGGRTLVLGEAVPEVWEWPQHMQQLHVKNGNLAFVTREQAEEMGGEAERIRIAGFKKDVQNRLSKATAAHAQQISKLKQIDDNRAAQALEVDKTAKLLTAAQKVVDDLEGSKSADEMWDKLKPVKEKPVRKEKPSTHTIKPEVAAQKKVAAQGRLNIAVAELATTEQLDIQTQFANKTYSALMTLAKDTYGFDPGKVSKNELIKKVTDAAKLRAVEFKRDEASQVAAAELAETLGEQE
jgi:hypothetical protein